MDLPFVQYNTIQCDKSILYRAQWSTVEYRVESEERLYRVLYWLKRYLQHKTQVTRIGYTSGTQKGCCGSEGLRIGLRVVKC